MWLTFPTDNRTIWYFTDLALAQEGLQMKVWPCTRNYPRGCGSAFRWMLLEASTLGLSTQGSKSSNPFKLEVRQQSQTFVSSAKPARGSLINRVWHWPREAAMHKEFSQPELRDGVLFLFHQKCSLKSENCLSTACMHSKSGQLTNKGRAGRKGQRKDIQILQKEVCDFQCLLCLNTFSSLLIPVLMLHDWLMEGWTVLLGTGPCNWQCVISCEQYYEESNLNAYFLTVKTWGYLI